MRNMFEKVVAVLKLLFSMFGSMQMCQLYLWYFWGLKGLFLLCFLMGYFQFFFFCYCLLAVLSQVYSWSLSRSQGQQLNFCWTSKSFLRNPQASKTNRKRGKNQRITSLIQEKAKERHNRMKKKGHNPKLIKSPCFKWTKILKRMSYFVKETG